MATTFVEYTGDGNATKQFTFPSYQESDVKVRVDGVLKTTSTHYNITNYTTTGGGNVVFTSGNIPSSPANIRIYRDTNVDAAKATFTAGSSVKAADLNNNTTQLLYRAQEEQIPNLIHSYDIDDSAIETSNIKANAVTTAKIADDAVTGSQLANNSINSAKIQANAVTSGKIADGTIVNADINASAAIDGSKIAASTTSAAGSMSAADKTKLDGIETGATADQTAAQIRTLVESATDSNVFTDADHTKLNGIETGATADQTDAQIRAAVEAATDSNVFTDADHSKLNAIEAGATADQTASDIKTLLQSDKLTANEIASNAVTTDKIADGELTTLAGMQSATASKLASSTALTADIADLNQIDGMAKQTTITDDDTKFPTSGAIVDYVAAQLEPFGGFEAIANESSFPNTQPVSGVVISIADAGGMVVSGSGTASGATVGGTTVNITGIASNFNGTTITTGVRFLVVSTGSGQNYTYHKATLREDDLASLSGDINDFSERYRVGSSNPTTSLDNGDLFFNTGSGKLLVYNGTNSAWEETQTVGNFFINTISSSSSTGGGSATPNGTAYRFTLSNAGTFAQQHLVSVDGVVQKPNSGTSQPSEGFAIDGADIIFGSAPVSGASLFVITIGASVSIGTPSNNTVTTAILQNGSVTTAKIVDSNVTTAKIAADAVTGAKIADDSINSEHYVDGSIDAAHLAANIVQTAKIADGNVTADKLAHNAVVTNRITDSAVTTAKIADDAVTAAKLANTSVSAGSYGSATAIPAITVDAQGRITAASTNTVNTTTNLGINFFSDSATVTSSTGTNVSITEATGSQAGLMSTTHHNKLDGIATGANVGITDVVNDTSPQLGGNLGLNGNNIFGDGNVDLTDVGKVKLGNSDDLQIYHDGSNSYILNDNNDLLIQNTGDDIYIDAVDDIFIRTSTNEDAVKCLGDGAVELYHNGNKKFETTSYGAAITGNLGFADNGKAVFGAGSDLSIYHDGDNNYIKGTNNDLIYIGTNNVDRWYFSNDGHFRPEGNNSYDIGSSSQRVRNIYTNDLHLSNEGSSNDMDGSWGDWTIQEGESDLFLKNNRSGKKYKFNLTEVS